MVRRPEKLSLLLIAAAVAAIIVPAGATCSGCGCYTPHPTEAEIQQFQWMKEAFCFLYSDDCYCGAAAPYYLGPGGRTFVGGTSAVTFASPQYPAADTAEYWLNQANELYLAGSYEKAAESYANAVEIDPYLLDGWLNMGNALFFSGRYEGALNAYNSALSLDPQNESAWIGKSQSLSALNRAEEANSAMNVVQKLQSRQIAELGGLKSTSGTVEPVMVGSYL
ncbi:MAG: tetratricopeptide repeat protein [Methanotrichaceae archaeon]|nr:tetratricopeptide repeat protein [Methanotrichaceae archaeon]